jgi:hypothetical protein
MARFVIKGASPTAQPQGLLHQGYRYSAEHSDSLECSCVTTLRPGNAIWRNSGTELADLDPLQSRAQSPRGG